MRAWAWETSIIPAPTKESMSENLTNLNDQLILLNEQILQAINTTQPTYKSQQDERAVQKQEITKNGEKLKKELDELKKIQKEHQELDEKDAYSKIDLTQNHYIYIAVFIISLIVLFMLFRFVFGSSGAPVPPQVTPASGVY
jgi:CHASE3 domain sensor protein